MPGDYGLVIGLLRALRWNFPGKIFTSLRATEFAVRKIARARNALLTRLIPSVIRINLAGTRVL